MERRERKHGAHQSSRSVWPLRPTATRALAGHGAAGEEDIAAAQPRGSCSRRRGRCGGCLSFVAAAAATPAPRSFTHTYINKHIIYVYAAATPAPRHSLTHSLTHCSFTHSNPKKGVRADLAVTSTDATGNRVGVGEAWTHNFLNLKPWHPASFRNRAAKYDAEIAAIEAAKAKERALVRCVAFLFVWGCLRCGAAVRRRRLPQSHTPSSFTLCRRRRLPHTPNTHTHTNQNNQTKG